MLERASGSFTRGGQGAAKAITAALNAERVLLPRGSALAPDHAVQAAPGRVRTAEAAY